MAQQSRSRFLLAVTLVSFARAQSTIPTQIVASPPIQSSTASYPPCAAACLGEATSTLDCEETDSKCLCAHQGDVRTSVTACLAASGACSATDSSNAGSYYERVCRSLGLDANGEPALAIAPTSIVTASSIAGLGPSSSPSATSSSPPVAATSSVSDQREVDKQEGNALSVPAVAGIAAGSCFIAVAIITGLIWMYIKRRDDNEELIHQIESQSQKHKPGFDSSDSSFKGPTSKTIEKPPEYALSAIPPKEPSRMTKPTLAERRNRPPHAPLGRSPSEALKKSTYPFPFGDKFRAEESMTSLSLPNSATKAVSANIVHQKSPIGSQFSDQASIYSISSFHSEEAKVENANTARLSRPTTFYNMYSNGAEGHSNVDLPSQPQPAPQRGQSKKSKPFGLGLGSLRRNKFDLQVPTSTVRGVEVPPPLFSPALQRQQCDNENPFTTPPKTQPPPPKNPFSTPSASAEERRNPFEATSSSSTSQPQRPGLATSNSFGKFDFEDVSDDEGIREDIQRHGRKAHSRTLRDSFFDSLDMELGGAGKP